MNYVVLDSGQLFASQVATANCVYDIRYVFDLQGNVVVIPDGCVLRFCGGMLTNGTISSNDLTIQAPLTKIFNSVTFIGAFVNGMTFEIEWFVDNYENEFIVNQTKILGRCSTTRQMGSCGGTAANGWSVTELQLVCGAVGHLCRILQVATFMWASGISVLLV